jgi:hypothetical protein
MDPDKIVGPSVDIMGKLMLKGFLSVADGQ